MGESSCSSNRSTLAIGTQPGPASYLRPSCFNSSGSRAERASRVSSIEETIEKSKSHWSHLRDFGCDNEVAEESNREYFKSLQAHPTEGRFFRTFGEGEDSMGELVMGEKFAEGGQAEIYEVQVKWRSSKQHKYNKNESHEHVLKVFKKGTFLCHLQSQWPPGMVQRYANKLIYEELGLSWKVRHYSEIRYGTLLEDGRFAFVMIKEKGDLRNRINHRMLTRSNKKGPFPMWRALIAMYGVAYGMNQLHNRGIVHRDIKASNVLLGRYGDCLVADFECSVGVVGTGFWRAPEILEACKYGNENTKVELFTTSVDIYSYGMTCYEILTGKLPFEGHLWSDYDLVLQGQRPKVPSYVDDWIQQLLNKCWHSNASARPSSQEILKILVANSTICWIWDLNTLLHNKVVFRIRHILEHKYSKIAKLCNS